MGGRTAAGHGKERMYKKKKEGEEKREKSTNSQGRRHEHRVELRGKSL